MVADDGLQAYFENYICNRTNLMTFLLFQEIDQILGCGQRNGAKFVLVRFKGEKGNQIIDWDTAKNYSIDVMEFLASRSVWPPITNASTDSDGASDDGETESSQVQNLGESSTSHLKQLNSAPNEIEFEK